MFKRIIVLILSVACIALLLSCQGDEGAQGIAGTNAEYIVLSPTTAIVIVDSTITITATTKGLDGTETYAWSSSNTDVATVNAAGVVTGVTIGIAFIGATGNSSGAASFASITVSEQLATEVSFGQHILPLFTTDEIWFPGTEKCIACHSGEGPYSHELDMGSWQGVITGADGGDEPILGNDPGLTNYDWGSSGLRRRLRNNRMPPLFPFVMDMSNRNGPVLENDGTGHLTPKIPFQYGSEPNVVKLMEAWVNAISSDPGDSTIFFSYFGFDSLTFSDDIQPFFTEHNKWFPSSESCVACHFDNSDVSSHEMDLTSYKGIMLGADAGAEPIIEPGDWNASSLRGRLRNNRMPPGAPFQFGQGNRNGPWLTHPVTGQPVQAVNLIGEWVSNGAPNN